MDRETKLLEPENLPLDLGKLGTVTEAEIVMPGVYDVVLNQETCLNVEAFIVLKSAVDISDTAKRYGETVESYPDFLIYAENCDKNPRYIISYELFRYKILHHHPLPEEETIRGIASYGAEMYPGYFGDYPVPFLTPWGYTTRHKIIANGLFWLETEQCQRGLAVASPQYDDLSDGARGLADKFSGTLACLEEPEPLYLFFRESDSSVPLFELLSVKPAKQIIASVDGAALMNAIYQNHPEYAAMYNVAEQSGQHDGFGLFLNSLGIPTKLHSSMESLIRLFPQSGTEFIDF